MEGWRGINRKGIEGERWKEIGREKYADGGGKKGKYRGDRGRNR